MKTQESTLYRPVATPKDWAAAVSIRNKTIDTYPISADEAKEWASFRPSTARESRLIGFRDGKACTYGFLVESFWLKADDRVEAHVYADPGEAQVGHVMDMLEHFIIEAKEWGATKMGITARTDREPILDALLARGFAEKQRNPESALDPREFDAEAFRGALDEVQRQGVRITSFAKLSEEQPETWKQEAYRLDMEIMRDVPLPEPWQDLPVEMFEKQLDSPYVNHHSQFVAIVDGRWAAQTQMHPNIVDPKLISTGLTGCRKEFRRRGLATALKTHALIWAKEHGAHRVGTDNEQKNPMYQLNLRLGFRTAFEWVLLERAI